MSNIRAESFFQLVSRMGSQRDSKNGKDWTCCCWHWGRWGYFRRHAVYLLKSSCGWHLAGEWRYQTYYERNRFYQQPEWVKKSIAPQSLQEKKKKKKPSLANTSFNVLRPQGKKSSWSTHTSVLQNHELINEHWFKLLNL